MLVLNTGKECLKLNWKSFTPNLNKLSVNLAILNLFSCAMLLVPLPNTTVFFCKDKEGLLLASVINNKFLLRCLEKVKYLFESFKLENILGNLVSEFLWISLLNISVDLVWIYPLIFVEKAYSFSSNGIKLFSLSLNCLE